MARTEDRLPENAPGDFFVDATCIDCDTCRAVAPSVFARSDASEKSYVRRQPAGRPERLRASMALVACPTSSIGTADRALVPEASRAYPEQLAEGVYYCGYSSDASFGASSYLIVREGGNVLVDSPRASKPLLARIRALGGARWMFLTHRDDVADHAFFARELGCERVLHEDDVTASLQSVEVRLSGREPRPLAPDLLVIPVPGHTRGSAALLLGETYLFSGDHLAGDDRGADLRAFRDVCWYSWTEQTRSMEALLDHRFSWVLPGHGRVFSAGTPERMRELLARLVERMRRGQGV